MRAVAGLLELWLEVLTHCNHGEMGRKEKGYGVGIEKRGGRGSWEVWEAERAWWSTEGSVSGLKGSAPQ